MLDEKNQMAACIPRLHRTISIKRISTNGLLTYPASTPIQICKRPAKWGSTMWRSRRSISSMKLTEIVPKDGYRLFLRYDDGACGEVDLSSYAG